MSKKTALEYTQEEVAKQRVCEPTTGLVDDVGPWFKDGVNTLRCGSAPDDGYDSLRRVFEAAVTQACGGKGKERHAAGEPFLEQTIMQIIRAHGLAFGTGQAEKKGREMHRLLALFGPERAQAELLGAMNYLAAAYLRLEEMKENHNG